MSKSDENLSELPFSKNLIQMQPCGLNGTGKEIIFVVN